MSTTPVRKSAVGFASTLKFTVPLLVLVRDERIEIQGFVFDTLQAQPTKVVTATEPVNTLAFGAAFVGFRVKVQFAPDWLMTNSCPATLTEPVRAKCVGLACTL